MLFEYNNYIIQSTLKNANTWACIFVLYTLLQLALVYV